MRVVAGCLGPSGIAICAFTAQDSATPYRSKGISSSAQKRQSGYPQMMIDFLLMSYLPILAGLGKPAALFCKARSKSTVLRLARFPKKTSLGEGETDRIEIQVATWNHRRGCSK